MDLARCGRIGSSQDGLITRQQALGVLASNQISSLLHAGTWDRVHESVYRIKGAPETSRQEVRSATLVPGEVVVAGRSAAMLWGMLESQPAVVEVMKSFTGSARLPGVTVHRTRTWPSHTGVIRKGIPVTNAARTIINLAAQVQPWELKRAIDNAITLRHLTLNDIYDEMRRIGTKGRKGCKWLGIELLKRIVNEQGQSPQEIDARRLLVEAGLPEPTQQIPVKGVGYVDLGYPTLKIAIEMQSWRWHGGPFKMSQDIRRKNDLRKLHWLVLEFDTYTTEADIVEVVASALAERESP